MKCSVLIRLMFLVVVALSVASCALVRTTKGYTEVMDSWVGSSEHSVLSSWGVPDSSYVHGEVKYLKYKVEQLYTTSGSNPTYRTNCSSYGTCTTTASGGSSPKTRLRTCATTFIIRDGRVASYSFEGRLCKAPQKSSDFSEWWK